MKKKINLTGVILCAGKGIRIKKMPFSQPKTLLEILGADMDFRKSSLQIKCLPTRNQV